MGRGEEWIEYTKEPRRRAQDEKLSWEKMDAGAYAASDGAQLELEFFSSVSSGFLKGYFNYME